MKIEYLQEGSKDCPLIRIYEDEPKSIRLLMENVALLITGKVKSKVVNDIEDFIGLDKCQVEIFVAPLSRGVLHIKNNKFECVLTKNDWHTVYELLAPLSESSQLGYQWLDETSNISLLVSRYANGQW